MSELGRTQDLWWNLTYALGGLFALTLVLYMVDGRIIDRESVWAKPLKFEASLAIHFATLTLSLSAVDLSAKWGKVLFAVAVSSVGATTFEMIYILIQAARQQASHFNLSNGFYAAMYVLMAAGAVIITLSAAVVGCAVVIEPKPALAPAVKWGLGIGLIGGSILTLITAFRMGGALDHHNGLEIANASRMPVTGWSLTVGDRRVPHFLATHMMQAVPFAGILMASIFGASLGVAVIVVVAAVWTAATLTAFAQANSGLPFTRLPL